MANIPITDNTTLLQSLKNKANNLPNKGSSGGTDVSGVTATAGDVLSGKVIVNSNGQEVTGTMPNNGAVSQTVTSNGDVPIAEGYHNGSGKITVNVEGGASIPTDGDAASGDVLSGKTFYSGGSKKTGTMKTVLFTNTIDVNKTTGKITATASSTEEGYVSSTSSAATKQLDLYNFQTTIIPSNTDKTLNTAGCFLTDNIVVKGDSNLVAGNIKKDVSIFGITGTYTGGTLDKQYRTASVTPTFESTSNGDMCVVVDNGVCAITPAYLLLYADPESWTSINSWSGDFIIAAYHDVAGGVTSVLYNGSNGFQKVQYSFSQGADRGYYERSGGYVSWGFRNDGYSTAGGNAKYKLIYMS